MKQKFRFFIGALMICLAMSQMIGCWKPPIPGEESFTGKWVVEKNCQGKVIKRSCVEGGSQCVAATTGLKTNTKSNLDNLYK